MTIPAPVDQVRIEHDDERVRCGPAQFTPFRNELEVRFLNQGRDVEVVKYDLAGVPFNKACLLHDGQGRPTNYLICNQWGTLYVRCGDVPRGQRYPALRAKEYPREIRLVDDRLHAPHKPSWAMHPNSRIPLSVTIVGDAIKIEIYDGGLVSYHFDLKLKKLPLGQWYSPRDGHGQPLPVRLRRPALAALFKVQAVDVQWVG